MPALKQTAVLPILFVLVLALRAAPPIDYPLHEAIRNSNLDRLTGLLQAGHHPDVADENGRTALHFAVARHQDSGYLYISKLLQFGADPNTRDFSGATALRYAAENGSAATTGLLLENGADPNLRTIGGGSPLAAAYIHGYFEIAGLLENYGAHFQSEAKRIQLQTLGRIQATLRYATKELADESLQRRRAGIARLLHDMREKYGLHDQLSDDGIRRIAREESSSEPEPENRR